MKDKKIRVIHFVDRIERGGSQAVLFDWLKNIDHEKIQFDFLVFMDGQKEYVDKYKQLGCNIYQIAPLCIKKLPLFLRELDLFFKTHRYDVAHGHSKSKNVFFLAGAKKNGVPIRIAHSHNTHFQRMAIVGELMKPLLKLVSTDFFACSDTAGIWLFGKKAYNQGKITVIKNGIDTGRFSFSEEIRMQYRKELGIDDAVVFGHVGKYMEQKNHTFLLDVFKTIHEKEPKAKLILIGSGHEEVEALVNEKIRKYHLDDCVLQMGLRSDVPEIMSAMDVFLLPSLYEGLPVVGIEAQSMGLPLLLSDTITREVALFDTTTFLSLNERTEVWANRALDIYRNPNYNRATASKHLYDAGYDSKLVAEYLLKYYEQKIIDNSIMQN